MLAENLKSIFESEEQISTEAKCILESGQSPLVYVFTKEYTEAMRCLNILETSGSVMRSDLANMAFVADICEFAMFRALVLFFDYDKLAAQECCALEKMLRNYADLVTRIWGWRKVDRDPLSEQQRYVRALALSVVAGDRVGEASLPGNRKLRPMQAQNWQEDVWLALLASLAILLSEQEPHKIAVALDALQDLERRKDHECGAYISAISTPEGKNLAAARLAVLDALCDFVDDRAGYADDKTARSLIDRALEAGTLDVLAPAEAFLIYLLRYVWFRETKKNPPEGG